MVNKDPDNLPLPQQRCLDKQQAATYLGIGITLFTQIGPKPIKLGRRCVYDRLDLDTWLEDYKQRGRASQEVNIWPETKDSTVAKTHPIGGSKSFCQTESEYKKALDL